MSDYQQAQIEAAQEFYANEMNVGASKWERWAEKVEAILDLPYPVGLDEDENVAGYSLDDAHDAFCAGKTPRQYANDVRAKRASMGL